MDENQSGFIPGRSYVDNLFIIQQLIKPPVREPVNVTCHDIFSLNHHSSAISWNISIRFVVIVNETLFLRLVYLLSSIHMF